MEIKTIEEYVKMSEEERYDYLDSLPEDERQEYMFRNRICMKCLGLMMPEEATVEVVFRKAGHPDAHMMTHVVNSDEMFCMNFMLAGILDQTTPTIEIDGNPLDE